MKDVEGLVLFRNEHGKWEVYDDTYDITIHCRNQTEQDNAVEMLHKAQQTAKEVMRPEDVAKILKAICSEHPVRCNGCPFDGGHGECSCKLKPCPDEWDV